MLSEALRLIRVFHDMKQTELANRLGMSKSYLSEIESGKKTPTMEILKRYSSEFGMPCSSIMFFSEGLENPANFPSTADRARGVIARKVINFLQLVEDRTADARQA